MFSFDKVIDRRNTNSVKWDLMKDFFGEEDLLPMWVADMDFPPPPQVITALETRVSHPVYGYTAPPSSLKRAILNWVLKRYEWKIRPSWITYTSGIVPAISSAIRAFTNEGDHIIVQTPVYYPFFEMINLNNRAVLYNELTYCDGKYEIDFIQFENQLKQGAKLFILCNPHNPVGRVWTKEELVKLANLCRQYNCTILSDEIHADLILKNKHIPIGSIDEKTQDYVITCIAPSKTFNIAGLQASALIIPNKTLRDTFEQEQKKQGFFTLNTFGITAMEAAYTYGEEWVDALIHYLQKNVKTVKHFIKNELPNVHLVEPEGTYLLWIDCRELNLSNEELNDRLLKKGKLALEQGTKYGSGGEGFIRMNIACPHETLVEGLARLKKALL